MTVNYTTLLALGQPVTGTETGTWGDDVNNAITSYLDIAIAGTLSLTGASFTAGALTLANTQGTNTATNISSTTAQYAVLRISSLSVNSTITAPSSSRIYLVDNADATYTVTIKASGQTGYTVATNTRAWVYFNGTDYVLASTNDITKLVGTLPVASGGTGATSLTANNVLLGNGTSALQVVAPGTNGNVLTSNGTTWTSAALPSGVSLSADNTWTGTQTFAGTSSKLAAVLSDAAEVATVSATAATGTINYDITTQSVLFYTTNASANWTVNLRASSGTSLNTAMSTGQSVTVAFLVTNGATAYYNTTVQVDGTTSGVTTRWQGGTAPTAGNASSVDIYVYTIIKTASATFSVFASQTRFA